MAGESMPFRCVIYVRVSTKQQALCTGLIRQLEQCTQFARQNNFVVHGVFCDIASAGGLHKLPQRDSAAALSKKLRCPVIVETRCRWSRMPHGFDPLQDHNVICASQAARDFEDRLLEIANEFMASAKQHRDMSCGGVADGR